MSFCRSLGIVIGAAVLCCGFQLSCPAAEWKLNTVLPADILQGWGAAEVNRSVAGNPLRVGGTAFAEGIGTHANGEIRLLLDGTAKRIIGAVGVDDGCGGGGSVRFLLLNGDSGKTLWDSGVRRCGDPARWFEVRLDGVRKLLLQCHDGGDGINFDHADWLDVKIEYAGEAPAVQGSPMSVITANARWDFFGMKGERLLQSGLQPKSGAPQPKVDAVRPYPLAFRNFTLPPTLRVVQSDGSHNLDLRLAGFSVQKKDGGGVVRNIYQLTDPIYPVEAQLTVTGYVGCDVFTSQLSVKNCGEKPVELLVRDAAFAALPAGTPFATTFSGGWEEELKHCREFELPPGTFSNENSGIAHTAVPKFPGVYLSVGGPAQEESGTVFAAMVGWSGSWHYRLHRTEDDRNFFFGGAYPDPVRLAAGAVYDSPEIVMTVTDGGKGQAARNLHRWAHRYGIANGKRERPVVLNSWEGVYFTFDESKLISMMDGAAALGAEMFVLDDGWFGNKYPRNDDRAGLGDWQCNEKKLPGGIEKLIAEAGKRGLAFGIWVEPEMVNPVSELFERHPDWVMAAPNRELILQRNQYVLDLSRPEVEEFVYNTVAGLLKKHSGIRYVKWDHNAFGRNAGSAALAGDQGALSDRYNAAYYRILARLRREFPAVMFQLCASGGGRVDYGAMRYHEEFWPSDKTNGIARIPIQWGYSHFFPANAMASHIGRHGEGDFKLRVDIAMTGRLGVELSPDAVSAADREVIKRGIAAYKELRPILHCSELYRGRSPHESRTTELTFVLPDKRNAVFFGFRREGKAAKELLKLSGLDPALRYRVEERNPDDTPRLQPAVRTGAELMERGLEIDFPPRPSSVVAKLTAEE